MSEDRIIDGLADFLREGGRDSSDPHARARELLVVFRRLALESIGVDEAKMKDAWAIFPQCGSGEVSVTIAKSEDDRWILMLTDAKEHGHFGRLVGLNKSISQYLRTELAKIEDELPE